MGKDLVGALGSFLATWTMLHAEWPKWPNGRYTILLQRSGLGNDIYDTEYHVQVTFTFTTA